MSRKLPAPTKKERKQVELLAGIGMTQAEIARFIGCGELQLRARFRGELDRGMIVADVKVMKNLFRMATGDGPEAARLCMFLAKTRRRMHEVQRIIHGYDPEMVTSFVKQVVALLRRDLPACCPSCKARLDLPAKIAAQLLELSKKMAEQLPPSEIVLNTPTDPGEPA